MKVEVQFLGNSVDMETYEGEYLSWVFVDGKLKKTLRGAVSTTVDLCLSLIAETKVTTEAKIVADYLTVKSNRDWAV